MYVWTWSGRIWETASAATSAVAEGSLGTATGEKSDAMITQADAVAIEEMMLKLLSSCDNFTEKYLALFTSKRGCVNRP